MLDKLIAWVADRLREKSTWNGLVAFLSAVGVGVNPELTEKIVVGGVAIIGVIEVVWPELFVVEVVEDEEVE